MRLSVVIPVYNELATIERLLAKVASVDVEKELVIIDDNSSDGTREFLLRMTQSDLIIIFHDLIVAIHNSIYVRIYYSIN